VSNKSTVQKNPQLFKSQAPQLGCDNIFFSINKSITAISYEATSSKVWIELAQHKGNWRAGIHTAINLPIP
jgi:hypothetical protein